MKQEVIEAIYTRKYKVSQGGEIRPLFFLKR